MKKEIKNLTLLMLYLCGWQEDSRSDPNLKIHRSWRGYPFEIIDDLEADGLLFQIRGAKSVLLTEDGIKEARRLKTSHINEA